MTERYEIRAPAVICDDVDGEVIAIDLEVGRYYRLTGQSARLWAWLTAGASPEEVAGACTDVDGATTAVGTFVGRLVELDLIRPSAAGAASVAPGTWELGDLDVESFSDLEDVLGMDPIHDVDPEVGWMLPGGG